MLVWPELKESLVEISSLAESFSIIFAMGLKAKGLHSGKFLRSTIVPFRQTLYPKLPGMLAVLVISVL